MFGYRIREIKAAVFSVLIIGAITFSGSAQAGDSSFSISPPPLAYPKYEAGSQRRLGISLIDLKMPDFPSKGISYAYLTRDTTVPGGANAMGQAVGLGFYGGILSGGGDMSELFSINQGFLANFEKEILKQNGVNGVVFGGAGANFLHMYLGNSGTINNSAVHSETYMDGLLYGFQGGAQFTFESGAFMISPFVQVMSMSGSVSVDSTTNVCGQFGCTPTNYSGTADVSTRTTSYGVDILHSPSGYTLSSLMQIGKQQQGDVKVTIIQISKSWGDGIQEASEKDGPEINIQRK